MAKEIRIWRPWQLLGALVAMGWYDATLWRLVVHNESVSAHLSSVAGWVIGVFWLGLEVLFWVYIYANSMFVTVTETDIRVAWLFGLRRLSYRRSMVARVHENRLGHIRIDFCDGRHVFIDKWSLRVQELRRVFSVSSAAEATQVRRFRPGLAVGSGDLEPLLPIELRWPYRLVWLVTGTMMLLLSLFVYEFLVLFLRLWGSGELFGEARGQLLFLALGVVYWVLVAFMLLRKYTTVLRMDRDGVFLSRFFGIVRRSWRLSELRTIEYPSRVTRWRWFLRPRGNAEAQQGPGIVVFMRTGDVLRFEYEGGPFESIRLLLESSASANLDGDV